MKKIILFVFLFLFASHFVIAETMTDSPRKDGDSSNEKYAMILLVEDNGTSLHIFKEKPSDSKGFPNIHEIFSEKNSATLLLFADNPESVSVALKNLLDHAALQAQHFNLTQPIHIDVFSHGEILFIPKEKREAIYQALQKLIVTHYKNIFVIQRLEALSGKMKALYGWITINYLEKHFQNGTPTFGSIYLNNDSLDIAYTIPKSEKMLDEFVLNIQGKKYVVFAKSFLQLGLKNIHNSILMDEDAKYCYPKESRLNKNEDGDFHLSNCSEILESVLKNANLRKKISPTFRVPQFIAFGDIYSTYHFFGIQNNFDKESFEQDTLEPQCRNTWDTLKNAYPTEPSQLLFHYCSHGVYFSDLFFDALDLREGQVSVANKIRDENIHWVLGAAIYPYLIA